MQPEVIETYKSARQLKEIDLTDKMKLLPVDKINNDFSVDVVVNKLKRSDAITSQIKEFRKGAQLFVIAMSKLFERKYCASIFDPPKLSVLPKKSCMRNSKFF